MAARVFSHSVDPVAYLWDIHNVTEAAIRFGCDDPLIPYLHARSFHAHNARGREEIVRQYLDAAPVMERSAYPPFRRAVALSKAGTLQAKEKSAYTRERLEAAERTLAASVSLLARSAAEDERTRDLEY